MSKYQNFTPNQFLKEIQNNPLCFDDFRLDSFQDGILLKNTVELDPNVFLLIPKDLINEDVALAAVKANPAYFDDLPKNARTSKVKLEVLKDNPCAIEFFDFDDVDLDCVKFLFVNYAEILDDFDDPKIQRKVDELVAKLKKDGVTEDRGE